MNKHLVSINKYNPASLFILIVLVFAACTPMPPKYESEVEIMRVKKNAGFLNRAESPLDSNEITQFRGIFYYPIDPAWLIKAKFTRAVNMPSFDMPHTLDRTYPYRKAGEAEFTINGKAYSLVVYTNTDLEKDNKLFVPFTDLTNGTETYGGGRYIEVERKGNADEIALDFNLSYFPYCAYSKRFSCPLVPKENHLGTEVRAGEKLP